MKLIQMIVVVGLVVLLTNCGISPKVACENVARVTCRKLIECTTDDAKLLIPHLKDQASCEAELFKLGKCDNESPCDSGKKYNGSTAEDCVIELNLLACPDIDKIAGKAPSCNKVCE